MTNETTTATDVGSIHPCDPVEATFGDVTETIYLDTYQRDLLADPVAVARLADWAAHAVANDGWLDRALPGLETQPADTRLIEWGVLYQDEEWGKDSQGRNVNWLDGLTFLDHDGVTVAMWLAWWAATTGNTPDAFVYPTE